MRRRILTLTVGLTSAVILAFAIPLAFLIFRQVESKALERARSDSVGIAQAISFLYYSSGSPNPLATTEKNVADLLAHPSEDQVGTTFVMSPSGRVVPRTPPGLKVGDLEKVEHDHDGDFDDDGGRPGAVSPPLTYYLGGAAVTEVRAPAPGGGYWSVYTYLSESQLHTGLWARWGVLGAVTVALLLAAFVAGEIVARRLARPLEDAAHTAERLAEGDTEARADTSGPREVAEVGTALNLLADRIDEVIATEREAVADLSHRMRTPLTALRLDVDALDDREDSERLSAHVNALERTLTAVIHAARRPTREGRVPRCDASAVVRRRVEFWSPLVVDQGRRTQVDIAADTPRVRVSADDLATAVDALIENVIAHTPEGTAVTVTVREDRSTGADLVVVVVSDEGPGFPPGVGVRGRSDRGSTGLGLDIARQCAEASGGYLRLGRAEGTGARVELWLGTLPTVSGGSRGSQGGHSRS